MKVYLIPGLGFDHQIFKKLSLSGLDITYLDWIEPLKDETFHDYCIRLGEPISNTDQPNVLIGHSLGGLASQEIATFKKIDKIILISSIKSREEMPSFFKMIGPMNLQRLFAKNLTLKTFKYWGKSQDYKSEEEQALFLNMVKKQSDEYLQWALGQLSIWQEPILPAHTNIIQIHGDADKTFPIKMIKDPYFLIKNGGHFMVFKHHEEIGNVIQKFLQKK